MSMLYRHEQRGYLMTGSMAVAMVAVSGVMLSTEITVGGVAVLAVLAASTYLFHSLTIEIDERGLVFYFSNGIVKKRITLEDIDTVDVVSNPWYYGWGIRFTPHGWLFNVSGLKAVEIRTRHNKRLRIGTDEPEKVKEVIDTLRGV
ncbi:MAG: hypothetical protein FD174_1884 [Geobacteraceae bacterium]|nr:MAG: hypothetical protein FD174_1884 [Geobacteraceae bacterium]